MNDKPLLDPGEYAFKVSDCKTRISQANNTYLAVALRIYPKFPDAPPDTNYGNFYVTIYDQLMDFGVMKFKRDHFFKSAGLVQFWESGSQDWSKVIGAVGHCRIEIEPSKGEWSARNRVADYIVKESAPEKEPTKPTKPTEPIPPLFQPGRPAQPKPRPTLAGEFDDEPPF